MSVGQLTEAAAIAVTAPKLKIAAASTALPNPNRFTMMCWAQYTGVEVVGYSDLMTIRAPGEVLGCASHGVAGTRRFSLGDESSDLDGTRPIPVNEWHHFTMTAEDAVGTVVRCLGYLDGVQECSGTLVPPVTPDFVQLYNSRESNDDGAGVYVGNVCGLKIWTDVALSPSEIRREMWTYMAQRKAGLWACSPMISVDQRTHNYGGSAGIDWTTQSVYFEIGKVGVVQSEPAGVAWDARPSAAASTPPRRWILGSH